jgi:hypothetical protein
VDGGIRGHGAGDTGDHAMTRLWGNPEWLPVHCDFNTAQLWREVSRVTVEFINRPENKKIIGDYVYGQENPAAG